MKENKDPRIYLQEFSPICRFFLLLKYSLFYCKISGMDHSDECQVYHLPKGAGEIQKVIYSSKSNQFVVAAKIPKKIPRLREGLLNFQSNDTKKQQ